MKKSYNFVTKLPFGMEARSVRQIMQEFLIPKKWQHYLRVNKDIKINGLYRFVNVLVQPGEEISLNFTETNSTQHQYHQSGNLPKIVYEDNNVLVINKPTGQKSHPNLLSESNTALNDAATYLAAKGERPFVTHRLDMLTSGLLMIAKNPVVVPVINRQLVTKQMQRFYLAQVNILPGSPPLKQGSSIDINSKIGPNPTDKRKRMVTPNGLSAQTQFTVVDLSSDKHRALLRINLLTGRTHQIRVHLSSIGLPIIGDPLYNPSSTDADCNLKLKLEAYKMEFIKPFSYETITVELPNKTINNIFD